MVEDRVWGPVFQLELRQEWKTAPIAERHRDAFDRHEPHYTPTGANIKQNPQPKLRVLFYAGRSF